MPTKRVIVKQTVIGELFLFRAFELVGFGWGVNFIRWMNPGPERTLIFRAHQLD